MKDSIKNRKNKLLALCLSALMLSSVAALGACKDSTTTDSSTSSSSEATSTENDTGLIKNANFKTYDKKNAINTSVTGWSRSTNSATSGSALSSKAASGVIDLDSDAWENLTGTNTAYNVATMTEEEAEAAWDELTIKDKLAYYDRWKKENSDGKITSDLSFYEAFNIDSGDIPTIARFDTHHKEGEEGYDERDTKVLMIHNQYPETDSTATYKSLGTAQKFTSSSTVTVAAGQSAEFSVWVKTQDLKSSSTNGSPQEAVDKGAFISITHSVGGKALDAYMVENINTENMDANDLSNGWKQYTFLLKGSSYVDTTFSVVLGLGQGGGTYRAEYVNGYAFFDDIQCNLISNEDYATKLQENGLTDTDEVGFEAQGEEKVVNVAKETDKDAFALNFYGDFSEFDVLTGSTGKATTSDNAAEGTVSSVAGNSTASWLKGGFDGSNDVTAVFENADAIKNGVGKNGTTEVDYSGNTFLNAVYTNYFEGKTLDATNEKILLLMSANGAAYTADAGHTFEFKNPVTGEEVKYLAVSFFVKTSDMNGYTGAGITLVDGNNKTSFSAIDTSAITPVEIGDNKDVYNGWQQCFFFVENASEKADTTFKLSFNFGPTDIAESISKDSYHPGFAAFTNFKVYTMTEDEYAAAQSGTYAKLVSVKGAKKDTTTTENGFDNTAGVPSNAIETGLAHLQNYKGVYSNSAYITGGISDSTEFNSYANAGLISKENFTKEDGYFNTLDAAWLNGLKAIDSTATASELWNKVFGNDATRPLLIWNDNSNKAYGYIGASTSIAANTYTAVSLRVKVSEGAKASIYLIDSSKPKYDTTLSMGRNLTYWYDNNGNICTGDPSEKATQVAFKLQTNGLYIANETWDGYEASMAGKYYANLNAYTEKNTNGDLLVADGGASHDYSDYWRNEGVDGIAYYYNESNKTYYADRAKTIAVNNIVDVTSLAPRYEAIGADNQAFMATVEDTQGEWKLVTFYIHTGDLAKNYRLEVWSGDRTGATVNPDGSYVIFDAYNPGNAESNFTGLLEEFEDKATDKFDGVFSYFDTALYLRYNASLDENKIGNLYEENYTATAQTEGIAYLKYETADELTVFADYQYSEKAVTASTPDTDEDETDDSSSETESETNIWLLASSLAIAIILVFVVISIIVRKVWAKVRKNRAAQVSTKHNKK